MSSRSSESVQNVLWQLSYTKMPLKLKHWGFYVVVLSYINVNGRQDSIQKGTEHVFRQTIECSYELSHHQLNHKYNITYIFWGGSLPSP